MDESEIFPDAVIDMDDEVAHHEGAEVIEEGACSGFAALATALSTGARAENFLLGDDREESGGQREAPGEFADDHFNGGGVWALVAAQERRGEGAMVALDREAMAAGEGCDAFGLRRRARGEQHAIPFAEPVVGLFHEGDESIAFSFLRPRGFDVGGEAGQRIGSKVDHRRIHGDVLESAGIVCCGAFA